ncbi:MAG: STAS domain-containing protein [Prolixibacteraceae bacterium]
MENLKTDPTLSSKVLRPGRRLDTTNCKDFECLLKPLIECEQFLIIDLSGCHYLSSSGIRILLKAKKTLLTRQGELFLTGVLPEVYQVLEMAGMQHIFRFEETPETACLAIQTIQSRIFDPREWTTGDYRFLYQPVESNSAPALVWKNDGIAGYDELGMSVGFGVPAEPGFDGSDMPGLFVTTGKCAAFAPHGQDVDFRVAPEPGKAGILIAEGISFGRDPSGIMQLKAARSISFGELAKAAGALKEILDPGANEVMLLAVTDRDTTSSLTVALFNDDSLARLTRSTHMSFFPDSVMTAGNVITGISFILDEWQTINKGGSLPELLNENLTIENITGIQALNPGKVLKNPQTWVFLSKGMRPAAGSRLIIETSDPWETEPDLEFLIRRLYTDSMQVKVTELYGGYSARTFQMTSYDELGRKMRPTVLKIANRALISRESERCRQYALPYIFNNSAVVLGTEYYGKKGALRYNFVGIGGEDSPLKWLTFYFRDCEMDVLEPIFDKIFLQILKPWYGQPVAETIYPFRDHDPTLTFFPHIYKMVQELFSVSADEKQLVISGSARPVLNPYWFLKHQFSSHRETGIGYYSGICHGDLNMQNILLDEQMNVYLIDFSETRPRSVISDFARLEAIFLVDNAPLEDESDLNDYLQFINEFYSGDVLYERKEHFYSGRHARKVVKHAALALKMREYASLSVRGNQDPLPYYLALLEWVLPVVCYTLPALQKQLSMFVSALLCEKLLKRIENADS